MRGLICTQDPGDALVAARTRRMLVAAGVSAIECVPTDGLVSALNGATEPIWLVRAGAWQSRRTKLRVILPSATGKSLLGMARSGDSCYLEPPTARALAELLADGKSLSKALQNLARQRVFRVIPLHDIEVSLDPMPRVLQLVTTIQIGGAERVVLDLAAEMNRQGVATAVAALAMPTRRAFPAPPRFFNLTQSGFAPENRADAVFKAALSFGADIVHGHLVNASEAYAIRRRGLPLVLSVHNILPSWPEGYANSTESLADVMLGCSRAVSGQLAGRDPITPARTVWNGIDPDRTSPSAERTLAGREMRESLCWDDSDFVLLAVANPRPQKRIHRLPEIIARLEDLIAPRRVRLLLAGEPSAGNAEAAQSLADFDAETERWHLRKSIHWAGAVSDVAPLLATADAFIAVSALEGLSLAQLEALAAGLPIVATDVGGTREIAERSPYVSLLSRDAAAEAFATVLGVLAQAPPPRRMELPADFTRERMAAWTRLMLSGALEKSLRPGKAETVWLITNNFTTGGAQSSARRLLLGLKQKGLLVRAATLEESPAKPLAGTLALRTAGVEVSVVPPNRDSHLLTSPLHAEFAAAPPRAVLLWNVMPSVKVPLVETLFDVPIIDVSPGEMYFRSLDRYFAQRPAGCTLASPQEYGRRLTACVVKYQAETHRAETTLGIPVHVVRNGVEVGEPQPRKARRHLIIGTAARIAPDKRLEDLLEAFQLALRHFPSCRLQIAGAAEAGSEEYARNLRKQFRKLPIEWKGHVAEMPGFLRDLDIFAMISEPAGCPNASLEAMAAGLPVIATDHGGMSEQVIDRVTGRLTPRRDHQAFADALVELAQNSELRCQMASAGTTHVRQNFSLDRMIEQYLQIIGTKVD